MRVPPSVTQLISGEQHSSIGIQTHNGAIDLSDATNLKNAHLGPIYKKGTVIVGPYQQTVTLNGVHGALNLDKATNLRTLSVEDIGSGFERWRSVVVKVPPSLEVLQVKDIEGAGEINFTQAKNLKEVWVRDIKNNFYLNPPEGVKVFKTVHPKVGEWDFSDLYTSVSIDSVKKGETIILPHWITHVSHGRFGGVLDFTHVKKLKEYHVQLETVLKGDWFEVSPATTELSAWHVFGILDAENATHLRKLQMRDLKRSADLKLPDQLKELEMWDLQTDLNLRYLRALRKVTMMSLEHGVTFRVPPSVKSFKMDDILGHLNLNQANSLKYFQARRLAKGVTLKVPENVEVLYIRHLHGNLDLSKAMNLKTLLVTNIAEGATLKVPANVEKMNIESVSGTLDLREAKNLKVKHIKDVAEGGKIFT